MLTYKSRRATKRAGSKWVTYKSRRVSARNSSTTCRNSTEAASDHRVTVTKPGVAYTKDHAEERETEAPAAKMRKRGKVRRVRFCLDTSDDDTSDDDPTWLEDDEWEVPKLVNRKSNQKSNRKSLRVVGTGSGAVESTAGVILRSDQQGGGRSRSSRPSRPRPLASTQGTGGPVPVSADTIADKPLHVKRIVRVIDYYQAVINGKQEVLVLFRALSSDGREVLVNNVGLRVEHPLVLIDFYEQHLAVQCQQCPVILNKESLDHGDKVAYI